MKKLLIKIILLYRKVPIKFHSYCRFTPSCSLYALTAIERFGALKGSVISLKRILRCHPFGEFGYDPVPEKRVKSEKNS